MSPPSDPQPPGTYLLVHGHGTSSNAQGTGEQRAWPSDSCHPDPETLSEHLIPPAASPTRLPVEPSGPFSPPLLTSPTPSIGAFPPYSGDAYYDCCAAIHTEDTAMAESIYSYYSDSDVEDEGDDDGVSDCDSLFDAPCERAKVISFHHPGRPSIIDLMRAEKPVFKRASQVIVSRPTHRPFISPIQPPNSFKKRPFAPPPRESDESSESDSSSQGRRSGNSSEPSTPVLDEDGSFTPTSDASPATPDTPKTSFEQDVHRHYPGNDLDPYGSPFKSKMRSRLRIFPKRPTSVSVPSEPVPQLPPLFTAAHQSITNLTTTLRSEDNTTSEREASLRVPQSPDDQAPLTARHIPTRSMWRDSGKAKFLTNKLRKTDARAGVNVH